MGLNALNTRMQKVANRLITKYGSQADSLQEVQATYDPLTESDTINNVVDKFDIAPPYPVTQKDLENTAVKWGDLRTWVPGLQFVFERSMIDRMVITFQGRKYRLIAFNPIYGGTDIAATELFLRDI